MPIQLKLRDDLEEAVAAYKHYDVLLVNAMFDGMNLVAKEGPLVNERDGVSILSREHRRPRGARRVRAERQPVRHPGARRLDPRRADDGRRPSASAALRRAARRSSPRAIRATGSTSSSPTSARRRADGGRAAWAERARRRPALPRPGVAVGRRRRARRLARTGRACGAGAALRARGRAAAPARRVGGRRARRAGAAPRPRALRRGCACRAAPAAGRPRPRYAPRRCGATRAASRAPQLRARGRASARPAAPARRGGRGGGGHRHRVGGRQPGGAARAGAATRRRPTTSARTRRGAGDVAPADRACSGAAVGSMPRARRAGGGFAPRCYLPPPPAWRLPWLHRPLYDLVLLLDTARRGRAAREGPRRRRARSSSPAARSSTATTGARARLAYEIRHKTDAEYHLAAVPRHPPTLLEPLERTLRITDGVVRFRIIKLAPGTPAPPESRPEPRPTGVVEDAPAAAADRRHRRPPAEPPRPRRAASGRAARPRLAGARSGRLAVSRHDSATNRGESGVCGGRAVRTPTARLARETRSSPKGAPDMAATNINRVIITGNLTPIPSCARCPAARRVCKLRVAVQHAPQGRPTGEWVDKPNYFDVTVWGAPGRELRPLPVQGPPRRHRRPPGVARVAGQGGQEAPGGRHHRRHGPVPRRRATTPAAGRRQRLHRPARDVPVDTGDFQPRPPGGGGGRRPRPTTTSRSSPARPSAAPTHRTEPSACAGARRVPGRPEPPPRGGSRATLPQWTAACARSRASDQASISEDFTQWPSSATGKPDAPARQEGRSRQRPAQALPVLQGQDRAGRLQGRRPRCAGSSPSAARSARGASPAPAGATRARSPAPSSAPASSRCCPTSTRAAATTPPRAAGAVAATATTASAMPEAILLKDVENLGERGAVVDVSKGYLRNFLIPRKLAQPATKGAVDAARQRRQAAGARRAGGRSSAPRRTPRC